LLYHPEDLLNNNYEEYQSYRTKLKEILEDVMHVMRGYLSIDSPEERGGAIMKEGKGEECHFGQNIHPETTLTEEKDSTSNPMQKKRSNNEPNL
jgi:hypothetical protein